MRIINPLTAIAATLGLLTLVTACGNKESSSEPVAEAESPATEDSGPDPRADYLPACVLKMTSPEPNEWKTSWNPRGKLNIGEGPSYVHSTYWARDEDHQMLVDSTAPPLEVTCSFENDDGDSEIMLTIAALNGLKEADVPYGPGTYPIVPRNPDTNSPKGFWVFPFLYAKSMFEANGGTLTVTRFDTKGMAGSFHIEGTEQLVGNRTIVIDGTFDIPCRGGLTEEKCTAGKAITD